MGVGWTGWQASVASSRVGAFRQVEWPQCSSLILDPLALLRTLGDLGSSQAVVIEWAPTSVRKYSDLREHDFSLVGTSVVQEVRAVAVVLDTDDVPRDQRADALVTAMQEASVPSYVIPENPDAAVTARLDVWPFGGANIFRASISGIRLVRTASKRVWHRRRFSRWPCRKPPMARLSRVQSSEWFGRVS